MSVTVVRPPPSLVSAFYDDVDEAAWKDIDWGTATPVNEVQIETDLNSLAKIRAKTARFQTGTTQVLPKSQNALLLHGLRQRFTLTQDHKVPETRGPDELIIKIHAVGLNPIDWKSVDFGFGIPQLPYVSGRDFAGVVVEAPKADGHLQVGDVVLCPSTDYRDLRKAAYQEYAVATHSTVCRLPPHVSTAQGAALGVAYVAATLALGVCLGLRMPNVEAEQGPDVLQIVRDTPLGRLPPDTIPECIAIEERERPQARDWLVIWGGSSTSALFLSQIARMQGLKVILVVDVAKHGSRLINTNGCICIDSHDAERAVDVIRGITGDSLRFGIDTVGSRTSEHLAKCLQRESGGRSHLVGLASLPKEKVEGVVYHSVPVKLFHEVPAVGAALMAWLEHALQAKLLALPQVDEAPGGLHGINDALDLMRQGQISGKRLVVPL